MQISNEEAIKHHNEALCFEMLQEPLLQDLVAINICFTHSILHFREEKQDVSKGKDHKSISFTSVD